MTLGKLVTSRRVIRYYANGKGYATARDAYRAIAKEQLKTELAESLPWEDQWWYKYNAFGTRIEGPLSIAFKRKYPRNNDGDPGYPVYIPGAWFIAVEKRARELRQKDEEHEA